MCNPELSDHRVTTRGNNNSSSSNNNINSSNVKEGPALYQTFPACQSLAVPWKGKHGLHL